MRKINLTPYLVKVDETNQEPYNIKQSIINILFHPDLRLSAKELLDNDKVSQKVEAAEGSVLLEDAEYEKVKKAFDTVKGFGVNDIELINRVFNAEKIEVKEA